MSTLASTSESQAIAKKVYRAFFSPSRYEVKPSDREIIEWGNNYRIPFEDGELAVTVWGSNVLDIAWWLTTSPRTVTLTER